MAALNELGLAEARDLLRAKETTSVELTEACLVAIEAADALNAFVHKTPDLALERARAADERLAQGDAPAMCGLPIGIKDLFCTKGVPSQAASRILDGFKPEYESTVSQNLADAGAVMLGKLNMDEFAMGSSNETSVYGNAVNPWRRGNDDTALTPGGSSGGSASAVAADLCLAATGTDTGGADPPRAAVVGGTRRTPTYAGGVGVR
ncbi:MAG: amidase family protein, partial [Arenibacterium sp.]